MSRLSFVLVALLALVAAAYGSRSVHRVEISTEEQLNVLLSFTEKHGLDVWSTPGLGPVDVLIPQRFSRYFARLRLVSSVLIEDVDVLINEERVRMDNNVGKAEFFEEYQTLDSIYTWIRQLAASYPSLVSTFVIGTSYEGREILAIRIRANRGATKEFFFNAGIHSR